MFQNYSETYASQIIAVSGFAVVLAKALGWEIAQSEIVFALGAIANVAGIVWAIVQRYKKGDVSIVGVRK